MGQSNLSPLHLIIAKGIPSRRSIFNFDVSFTLSLVALCDGFKFLYLNFCGVFSGLTIALSTTGGVPHNEPGMIDERRILVVLGSILLLKKS